MRFMVIVKATKDSEAGKMPSEQLLSAMGKFNEELVNAGVMLAADGLQPSSKGARVKFSGSKRTVIDGPFAETKKLIAGYWVWKVNARSRFVSCSNWRTSLPARSLSKTASCGRRSPRERADGGVDFRLR